MRWYVRAYGEFFRNGFARVVMEYLLSFTWYLVPGLHELDGAELVINFWVMIKL